MLKFFSPVPAPTPKPSTNEGAVIISWEQRLLIPGTTAVNRLRREAKAGSFVTHVRHGKVKLVRADGIGQLIVEMTAQSKFTEEAALMPGSDRLVVVEATDCGPPFSSMVKVEAFADAAKRRGEAGERATNPHAALLLASRISGAVSNLHASFFLAVARRSLALLVHSADRREMLLAVAPLARLLWGGGAALLLGGRAPRRARQKRSGGGPLAPKILGPASHGAPKSRSAGIMLARRDPRG